MPAIWWTPGGLASLVDGNYLVLGNWASGALQMDVKEAVGVAKSYFADLFGSENFTDQSLEEIDFDDSTGTWEVTIGFRRPPPGGAVGTLLAGYSLERSYKVVRISDATGKVSSVKNREIQLT